MSSDSLSICQPSHFLNEPSEINERYLIQLGLLKPVHERKRQAGGLAERGCRV